MKHLKNKATGTVVTVPDDSGASLVASGGWQEVKAAGRKKPAAVKKTSPESVPSDQEPVADE
ncbi:DUF7302 family protein [Corynebacterium ulceribovis]|uniref:DUF7302 family protein n=1 Tax=Corynebacterium ulceribovis TaxID=487732 RepID=UPI00037312E5|nr:hypothetical protein [Corynebacterium ulceribovis]